jgi:ribosomal protein S27E
MAILELDKIIIKKPDTGIQCIHCGGDLKQNGKIKLLGKIVAFITFGKVRIRNYQCENCKKKYIVL